MNDFSLPRSHGHEVHPPLAPATPPPTTDPRIPDDLQNILPPAPETAQTPTLAGKHIGPTIETVSVETTGETPEQLFSALENGAVVSLLATEMGEKIFELYAANGFEAAKSSIEFLEKVLPEHISELSKVKKLFTVTNAIATIGAALTIAINVGAGMSILFYKQKILKESRKALDEITEKVKVLEASGELNSEELKEAKKVLNEWGARINAESEMLEEETNVFIGKSISETTTGIATLGGAIATVGSHAAVAAGAAATIGSSALAAKAYFEMKEKIKDSAVFNEWQQEFTQWQKDIIPQFTVELTPPEVAELMTPPGETAVNASNKSFVELSQTAGVTDQEVDAFQFDSEHKTDLANASLKPYYRNSFKAAAELPDNEIKDALIALKVISPEEELTAKEIRDFREFVKDLKDNPNSLENLEIFNDQYQTWFEETKTEDTRTLSRLYLQHQKLTHTRFTPTQQVTALLAKRDTVKGEKIEFLRTNFPRKREAIYRDLQSYYKEALRQSLSPDANNQQILAKLRIPVGTNVQEILDNPEALNTHYDSWFEHTEINTRDALIELYIDHHQTIETTVKHSLREVVDHKLKIESDFVKLSLIESKAAFGAATTCAFISLGLLIAGLITLPLGGAGAVLILAAGAPTAVSVGFFIAGLVLSFRKKPKTTLELYKGLNSKLLFNRLMKGIRNARAHSKAKKVKAQEALITALRERYKLAIEGTDLAAIQKAAQEVEKAVISLQNANEKLIEAERKAARWTEKVADLEQKLGVFAWQDFAKNASLMIGGTRNMSDYADEIRNLPIKDSTLQRLESFDSLTAFREALMQGDLDLISDETRYLLESQLGMDIKALQKMIKENPNLIELALQKFSGINQDEVVRFIERQRARMAFNLIPSATPIPLTP